MCQDMCGTGGHPKSVSCSRAPNVLEACDRTLYILMSISVTPVKSIVGGRTPETGNRRVRYLMNNYTYDKITVMGRTCCRGLESCTSEWTDVNSTLLYSRKK